MPVTAPPTGHPPVKLNIHDAPHAPIVFFDGAPNSGNNNGVVNITLAVSCPLPTADNGVDRNLQVAAYLRCSIPAAIDLRNAINNALLIAATPKSDNTN